jgi:preprotein translocase subunit SecD
MKAITGVDVDSTFDKDAMILRKRASESQEALRNARIWNLEIYPDRQAMPSSQRARKRGGDLFERATDRAASLAMRDALYAEARRYFDFGGFESESASVESAHESIESALQAERDRQDELLDQAAARLSEEAASIRQAAEDMKKTDSEKQSFKDEADALEDELGF